MGDNMPNMSVSKLDKSSHMATMKAALSECIAEEMHKGREQQQAIAMCSEMIKEKTGKDTLGAK